MREGSRGAQRQGHGEDLTAGGSPALTWGTVPLELLGQIQEGPEAPAPCAPNALLGILGHGLDSESALRGEGRARAGDGASAPSSTPLSPRRCVCGTGVTATPWASHEGALHGEQ